ncbi:hypothetical protein LTR85_003944 [Meristemomyces frigidus]|nr:hypothetical protein LTR85_003944 [Meristemomyces frigidus]
MARATNVTSRSITVGTIASAPDGPHTLKFSIYQNGVMDSPKTYLWFSPATAIQLTVESQHAGISLDARYTSDPTKDSIAVMEEEWREAYGEPQDLEQYAEFNGTVDQNDRAVYRLY